MIMNRFSTWNGYRLELIVHLTFVTFVSSDVKMGEMVSHVQKFVPRQSGERKLVATFSSRELIDVIGSRPVLVRDWPFLRDWPRKMNLFFLWTCPQPTTNLQFHFFYFIWLLGSSFFFFHPSHPLLISLKTLIN